MNRKTKQDTTVNESAGVDVFTRIRPPLSDTEETTWPSSGIPVVAVLDNYTIRTVNAEKKNQHEYTFNQIFGTNATQEELYRAVGAPLVKHIFSGYNTCLLAYGQTGCGKTHTMMGGQSSETMGVIPRFLHDIFLTITRLHCEGSQSASKSPVTVKVEIAYFEIYCEKVLDLLPGAQKSIKVRESDTKRAEVAVHPVDSVGQVLKLIQMGNMKRTTAATAMNDRSSRSHAILQVVVHTMTLQRATTPGGAEKFTRRESISNLVDLAGSENQKKSLVEGQRLTEMTDINKSLLSLGRVIDALSKNPRPHVPYRDSALTSVLEASLGGNSRTSMIAMVSPSTRDITETDNTLNYAKIAKRITNDVHINEDSSALLVRELTEEVRMLKEKLKLQQEHQKDIATSVSPNETRLSHMAIGTSDVCMEDPMLAETQARLEETEKSLAMVQTQIVDFVEHNSALQSALAESEDLNQTLRLKALEIERLFVKKMDNVISKSETYQNFMRTVLLAPGPGGANCPQCIQLRTEVFLNRKHEAIHLETMATMRAELEERYSEVRRVTTKCTEITTKLCDVQNKLMRVEELEMRVLNLSKQLDLSQEKEAKYLEEKMQLTMENFELKQKAEAYDNVMLRMQEGKRCSVASTIDPEAMQFFGFSDEAEYKKWITQVTTCVTPRPKRSS